MSEEDVNVVLRKTLTQHVSLAQILQKNCRDDVV